MILALISGLGGVGLIAGIALKLFGVAGSLVKLRAVKDAATRIPKWVYIAGGVILALLLGLWWHGNKVEAFGKAQYEAGVADEAARTAKKAREIEAKAIALTQQIRTLSDETNRRIDADARSLLVRGPGKAACGYSLPAASGGREQAGGAADAALPRVSYPEWQSLIGMPFTSTVEFARLCDANRAEALSWRQWHRANDDLHQGLSK